MLAALGIDAVALRDKFPRDIEDEKLLDQLRDSDFDVWISGDRKQLTRPAQALLLRSSKVTALYLAPFWGGLKIWPQATWLVKQWPRIEGFVRGATKGVIAEVKQNGTSQIIPL